MTDRYLLHLIGNGLYGAPRFIREAKRLGVNRAMPLSFLKTLTFGQNVLLGEHISEPIPNSDEVTHVVRVFGYFHLSGITYDAPDEVRKKVAERLHVVEVTNAPLTPQPITRACGSYCIIGGYVVTDSLEDIVKVIEDVSRELNYNSAAYRFFINGELNVFDSPVLIHNQKFFRGYKFVELEGLNFREDMPRPSVTEIYSYERRKYIKKKDRSALDSTLIEEYSEITNAIQ